MIFGFGIVYLVLGFLVMVLVILFGGFIGFVLNLVCDLGLRFFYVFFLKLVFGEYKGDLKWWYFWVLVVVLIAAVIAVVVIFKFFYL